MSDRPQKLTQKFREAPVSELKPHPKNPRRGDVSAITASIEANGFYGTIVVQKSTGYILAGNHRYLAAKEAGLDSVPVVMVDCDDATAKRILLVDNRLNDKAGYNEKALTEILSELSNTSGLDGTGYTEEDLEKLIRDLAPEFDAASEDEQGRLDKKGLVCCPECGHEFSPR